MSGVALLVHQQKNSATETDGMRLKRSLTCEERSEAYGHMEETVEQLKVALAASKEEQSRLRKQLLESQRGRRVGSLGYNSGSSPSRSPENTSRASSSSQQPTVVGMDGETLVIKTAQRFKVSELIRLKGSNENTRHSHPRVLGSDLSVCGVDSTKAAELLVSQLEMESRVQEALQTNPKGSPQRLAVFEMELDRIRTQAAHLRSQLQLLEMNLNESRENCDNLAVLCAQLEANQTALNLALEAAESALEIQDSIMSLLTSQTDSTGPVATGDAPSLLRRIAQQIFDGRGDPDSIDYNNDEDMLLMKSLSASSPLEKSQWFPLLHNRLQRLRSEIVSLKNTVVSIPQSASGFGGRRDDQRPDWEQGCAHHRGCWNDHYSTSDTDDLPDIRRIQLENAVLIQELQFSREEKADLKAQHYLATRENADLKLTVEMEQNRNRSYQLQIAELTHDVNQLSSTSEHGRSDEDEDRKELKQRVWELAEAVETLSTLAQLRHTEAQEFINDLKQANSALVVAFERSQRKHENKLRRMETQKEKELNRLRRSFQPYDDSGDR